MRALLCPSPRKLSLVERPAPVAAPGAPLVRIRWAGVCGAALHIFEGTQPYFEYPRVTGHELGGEIAAVAGPSRFRVGQQVAVLPYVSCGACGACRRGKPNCCQRINVIGVHSDGGFADWLVVPEDNLIDAEGVSLDEAAMAERRHVLRSRVSQTRNNAARQPQRDARRLRHSVCGAALRRAPDAGARQPSRFARRRGARVSALARPGQWRRQGANRDLNDAFSHFAIRRQPLPLTQIEI